ncbi:MAG: ABC transporter ATP-binding protein [Burkholderiales bacterium]|nr:ABC transporter ATP-binding protein [Burkholderiales bacterium]MDE1927104.1 ABC transporter ATP-binding protein [Burkholderiales bacterium]MDE2159684.1 ABC transporter ATP-binding protein [Burkholderiales bacterium]MDE2502016.1 ABC transporter ATP-binding protein [Burkholderiales bacterium]
MGEGLLLEVRGLHAGYGKAEVLRGVTIAAPAGSVITVIGPNGAGKSTLLGALMGLLPAKFPQPGDGLRFEGEDIARLTLEERVMRGLALVPERRELFGSLSVEDNLVLGGWRPRRLGVAAWRDGIERVFELFPRLKERREQPAGTLSGGERQMLAIGRALMGQPKLLMLDEPSLGLAPLIVRDIFTIIGQLRRSGVTILLVEQNARAALDVADRGYVLETGDLVLEGPAADLADDPRVIETYLGAKRESG